MTRVFLIDELEVLSSGMGSSRSRLGRRLTAVLVASPLVVFVSPSDFDVAMCLMNAVDHEQYEFVKLHLEEDNNLTLEYAKQRFRTIEQKLLIRDKRKLLTRFSPLCMVCVFTVTNPGISRPSAMNG